MMGSVPARHRKHELAQALRAGLIEMFYTYVLKSKLDNKLYVGFCSGLRRRFDEHNSGKVLSTKSRVPFKIIYTPLPPICNH